MTLTFNTPIRPLAEEHLRMFRRMIPNDNRGADPKITSPKDVVKWRRLVPLENDQVRIKDARRIAKEHGGHLPSLRELILALSNKHQYETLKQNTFWLSDIGIKFEGHYEIDYMDGSLKEFPKGKMYYDYPWKMRARIFRGNRPLTVGIGKFEFGLDIDGARRNGPYARVAIIMGEVDSPALM